MHIKSVYLCYFVASCFYYSLIFRCIYMLQAYRYRRVEENRDLSVFLYYRFQTNSSVALSIGSARQEIIYGSILLANREVWNISKLRFMTAMRARELFRVIIVSRILQDEKEHARHLCIFFPVKKKKRANQRKVVTLGKSFFKIDDYQKHLSHFLEYWHILMKIRSNSIINLFN